MIGLVHSELLQVISGHARWLKICGGPLWVIKEEIGMLAPQTTENAEDVDAQCYKDRQLFCILHP